MNTKFCPRCGTANKLTDAYCIKCGYAFRRRKSSFTTIILLIILLIAGWIAFRLFTNQSIIPTQIVNLFQNSTSNLTIP
ncbi:MAG: zinc ribbon domain-containing protein [Candidatus Pacearchaeota archaeon]|jgi:predicted nucleic acid-binding Zn ribbon protein